MQLVPLILVKEHSVSVWDFVQDGRSRSSLKKQKKKNSDIIIS